MTDLIKAKIQELCPDVIASQFNHINIDGPLITLAVVLRAIQKHAKYEVDAIPFLIAKIGIYWNLEKDRWEDQTKETKLFVGSLLGVV